MDQHASRFRSSSSLFVLFLISKLSIVHLFYPAYLLARTFRGCDCDNSHIVRMIYSTWCSRIIPREIPRFSTLTDSICTFVSGPFGPVSAISYLIYISLSHYISISSPVFHNANTTEVIPSRTSRVTGHQSPVTMSSVTFSFTAAHARIEQEMGNNFGVQRRWSRRLQ